MNGGELLFPSVEGLARQLEHPAVARLFPRRSFNKRYRLEQEIGLNNERILTKRMTEGAIFGTKYTTRDAPRQRVSNGKMRKC